jgi:hypothetical protein
MTELNTDTLGLILDELDDDDETKVIQNVALPLEATQTRLQALHNRDTIRLELEKWAASITFLPPQSWVRAIPDVYGKKDCWKIIGASKHSGLYYGDCVEAFFTVDKRQGNILYINDLEHDYSSSKRRIYTISDLNKLKIALFDKTKADKNAWAEFPHKLYLEDDLTKLDLTKLINTTNSFHLQLCEHAAKDKYNPINRERSNVDDNWWIQVTSYKTKQAENWSICITFTCNSPPQETDVKASLLATQHTSKMDVYYEFMGPPGIGTDNIGCGWIKDLEQNIETLKNIPIHTWLTSLCVTRSYHDYDHETIEQEVKDKVIDPDGEY